MLDYTVATLYNIGDTLLMFVDSGLSLGLWALIGVVVYAVINTVIPKKKK